MNDEAQDPYGMAVVLAFRELVTLQEQDSPFITPSEENLPSKGQTVDGRTPSLNERKKETQ